MKTGNKKKIVGAVVLAAVIICLIIPVIRISKKYAIKAEEPVSSAEKPEREISDEVSTNKDQTTFLVTEDDYRNALSSCDDNGEKIKIYAEFAKNYRLDEAEYLDYAKLCEEAGDTVSQRNVLLMLYRTDPTEEHGQLLSNMVLQITPSDDENAKEVLNSVVDAMDNLDGEDFSSTKISDIVGSKLWKQSFYIENGTFTSNTKYNDNNLNAEVESDSLYTRVVITSSDMRYLCEVTYNGVNVGVEELKDGKPGGKYCYRQMDTEDVDILRVDGYTDNGHYVNQIKITVGDTCYQGVFDSEGKTKEEQPDGLAGVAYAYTEDRSKYLYVADVDAVNWIADISEMGFEEF